MPGESGQQQGSPSLDIRAPTINITESNRQGIIDVMFKADPRVVDWVLNTFRDSHLENQGTAENPRLVGVPNSKYYRCTYYTVAKIDGKDVLDECKVVKSVDRSLGSGHLVCSGTKEKSHPQAMTEPESFHPILSNAGMYYILGQVNGAMNTNIATGNFSASENDLQKKMSLEDRMRYNAWYLSFTMIAVVVGSVRQRGDQYYSDYVADEVLKERKLHMTFSSGFVSNFEIQMTNNILANYTKGKGMAAAGKAMDTHVSSETYGSTKVEYPPVPGGTQTSKSFKDNLRDMFKL